MSIGRHIRKQRKQQNRTLDAVAQQVGITKSMLSKIETGKAMPAVATLTRIAAALGVEVSSIIDQANGIATVFTAAVEAAKAPLIPTEKGYDFFPFASRRVNKAIQAYLFVARKGKMTRQPLSHAGEEFIYVLTGRMKYRVGNVEYTMGPGDSIYFDAEDEHDLQPVTDEVRYLGIFVDHSNERN